MRGHPGLSFRPSLTMPEIEEPSRPKAVTVIGWLWLVVGVFFLFRAVGSDDRRA